MSEDVLDEQSHYEISLTAGQAFVAFVLLLLSLAASFAFGLTIGKGQADDRLVVRKEPSVITEASVIPRKSKGKIVELGIDDHDFSSKRQGDVSSTETTAPLVTGGTENPAPAATQSEPEATAMSSTERLPVEPAHAVEPAKSIAAPQSKPAAPAVSPAKSSGAYAQLLSTSDQKTAETLAAKVINGGFTTAWVERVNGEKGMTYRVRVRFDSEADARAAESKLHEFSKDVWIVK